MDDSTKFADIVTELLGRGHSVRFQAPGRSMHPTIKEGETITVEPMEPSEAKKGDIILYRCETGLVAHRVVEIEKEKTELATGSSLSPVYSFKLRGDASVDCDLPVGREQVLGKVASVERAGRSIELYTWRASMVRIFHSCASRIKRRMMRLAKVQSLFAQW